MKLTRARVTNYRSIDDSTWVNLEDVTALVGKNESGKTAFLQALRKINSIAGIEDQFSIRDYPRKGYIKYKKIHQENPGTVVQAEFQLSEAEFTEIESFFGKGILSTDTVVVGMNYKNERSWDIEISSAVINQPQQSSTEIELICKQIEDEFLEKWLPKFVYFDNYSIMRGKLSINDLQDRLKTNGPLDDADRTFLSLLTLSGVSLEDLQQDLGYEDIKVELESASINITDEIFEYWHQNRQLKVEFDVSQADPRDPAPLNEGKILHVRIENSRHRVTVSFDERSKGFVWFFSFLAYFSHLEETESSDLVILLDEPGTALHAMAQKDFLRFMDERLAPRCQVVYSTHSPFMVDLQKLQRVRTVQDMDGKGTVISQDASKNDRETVFPLQMALGYQMAQTLFMAPHCLMVNNPSDLIYLQVMGNLVSRDFDIRIDPRWVIIPIGGTENLSTFISLLGENYVSVAVMMDITPTNRQKIDDINQSTQTFIDNPVKWVEVTRIRDADIEDLFPPNLYLDLVNQAYGNQLKEPLTMKLITDRNPRIVERISLYFDKNNICGGVFDRYIPAAYLLENFHVWQNLIPPETVEKISTLISKINSLLADSQEKDIDQKSNFSIDSNENRSESNKDSVSPFDSIISEIDESTNFPVQTQF